MDERVTAFLREIASSAGEEEYGDGEGWAYPLRLVEGWQERARAILAELVPPRQSCTYCHRPAMMWTRHMYTGEPVIGYCGDHFPTEKQG